MQGCAIQLVDQAGCLQIETPRTEDVECLCKLMSTVGSQLENSTKYVKAHMDAYFERMDKMSKLPNLEVSLSPCHPLFGIIPLVCCNDYAGCPYSPFLGVYRSPNTMARWNEPFAAILRALRPFGPERVKAVLAAFRERGVPVRSSAHPPGKAIRRVHLSQPHWNHAGVCLKPVVCCLQSRLKFMIRDVADLRKNRWQERRKTEGPKTIEEIHRDARMEAQQAARLPEPRGPRMSGGGPRGGGFGQPPMGARPPIHLQ